MFGFEFALILEKPSTFYCKTGFLAFKKLAENLRFLNEFY